MAIPYSSVPTGADGTAEKCSFAATGADETAERCLSTATGDADSAGTCALVAADADVGDGGIVNKPL